MTPIHEMKTRKAMWRNMQTDSVEHGAFFDVDGREVGVVIRDQPEEVAKPLIEAIAALPVTTAALMDLVALIAEDHTFADPENEPDSYAALVRAREALKTAGVLP